MSDLYDVENHRTNSQESHNSSGSDPLEMPKKGKGESKSGAGDAMPGLAPPTLPGPKATEAEWIRYQRDLQKYNRMFEMYSKIMSNAYEMKKEIVRNLPR